MTCGVYSARKRVMMPTCGSEEFGEGGRADRSSMRTSSLLVYPCSLPHFLQPATAPLTSPSQVDLLVVPSPLLASTSNFRPTSQLANSYRSLLRSPYIWPNSHHQRTFSTRRTTDDFLASQHQACTVNHFKQSASLSR